jgi:Glucodextranase, domain B
VANSRGRNREGLQISWTTITYRSVLLSILFLAVLVSVVAYILAPGTVKSVMAQAGGYISDQLEKMGLISNGKKAGSIGPQQAHFTAIDGAVKVKRANSNTWQNADYSVPLEKGDVVQTGSEGIAKVVFADGTSYTVKQDSLIVVEDNSVNANQQTQVSVQVTTGTVDLSTATFSQGSSSQVVVAGARATFAPDTSAHVKNDPRGDVHEIQVNKGSGEVLRGSETVRLGDFEKVDFKNDSTTMAKSKVLGPPVLIGPANMAPIFTAGKLAVVQFSWAPVENVAGYHLRVSRNPYFSSTVIDEKVATPELTAELSEGAYYWSVQSLDEKANESIDSEKNRFTVIPKGPESVTIPLELENFIQHGHVIEVRGKTEPNARVMVNGQEVPLVTSDGSFQFLTAPLPSGENILTITAQNTKGGVNTKQKKIVIQ